VASTLAQEGVSRVFSSISTKLDDRASGSHNVRRLDIALSRVEYAIERTAKMPITCVSLLRRWKMLMSAYNEGVDLLNKHEGVERSPAEELAIRQKLVRVGNKEIHTDSLVLEEPQKSMDKIPIDEQNNDYRYEYVQGESSRYNKECEQLGSIYRLVGENLGKYIISTGKADVTICTRVLTVVFTEYNRRFCLSLWDLGG